MCPVLANTHTCIHARAHTCTNTHTRTRTHTHTKKNTHMHTHTHTHTRAHTHTHTHACAHKHTCTPPHPHTHSCARPCRWRSGRWAKWTAPSTRPTWPRGRPRTWRCPSLWSSSPCRSAACRCAMPCCVGGHAGPELLLPAPERPLLSRILHTRPPCVQLHAHKHAHSHHSPPPPHQTPCAGRPERGAECVVQCGGCCRGGVRDGARKVGGVRFLHFPSFFGYKSMEILIDMEICYMLY